MDDAPQAVRRYDSISISLLANKCSQAKLELDEEKVGTFHKLCSLVLTENPVHFHYMQVYSRNSTFIPCFCRISVQSFYLDKLQEVSVEIAHEQQKSLSLKVHISRYRGSCEIFWSRGGLPVHDYLLVTNTRIVFSFIHAFSLESLPVLSCFSACALKTVIKARN
jgi:hypothetical protein